MNDAYQEGIMYLVNNVHLSKVHLRTIVYSIRQSSPFASVQAHHYQNATKVNASLYKYQRRDRHAIQFLASLKLCSYVGVFMGMG